jgi:hypothetical protein
MRWNASEPFDTLKWHRWFAWRPVPVGDKYVWLEWIERIEVPGIVGACDMGGWAYREIA